MANGSQPLQDLVQEALQVTLTHDTQDDSWNLDNPGGLTLGKVIEGVANALQVTAPPLPDFIAGLDLTKLSVKTTVTPEGASTTAVCCDLLLSLSGKDLELTLTLDTAGEIGGTVQLAGQSFTLDFKQKSEGVEASQRLLARYEGALAVGELAADLPGLGDVLQGVDVTLSEVLFGLFTESGAAVRLLLGLTLDSDLSIDLSGLPAVGSLLPKDVGIKALTLYASSGVLNAEDVEGIEGLELPPAPEGGGGGPPPVALGAGLSARAVLRIGDKELSLPPAEGSSPPPAESQGAPVPQDDGAKWLNLNQSFGPLSFERVGVDYRDQVLWFLVDASFDVGILTLSADGLAVGSHLDRLDFQFKIHGLSLDYRSGPLAISGGFVASEDMKTFDGQARIDAELFSVVAIGEYSDHGSYESAYVFAALDAVLGGPEFFIVTGLAAGFGYHSRVVLPDINGISDHVLIQAFEASSPENRGSAALIAAMQSKRDIVPDPRECWLAAGLRFTSFELITTEAILVVDFGHELEIGVLGLSTVQIPPAPEPFALALVELALELKILPDEGEVSAMALLTPASYVLDPACKLTGGFALSLWFGDNPHAGQFVLTIGGYHPLFTPPSYYPVVPRLGFHWSPELGGGELTIEGGAYFALTPSAVMAGGKLSAIASLGPIRAWFIAFFDALIEWAPFHFEMDFGISIGVSVKLLFFTLKIELGCQLYLWGPQVGGRAHVSYYLVSFTIPFGPDNTGAQTLPWDDFAQQLLPAPAQMLTTRITGGLLSENGGTPVVRKDKLRLDLSSAIPAMKIRDGAGTGELAGGAVNVRPVGAALSQSDITVRIRNRTAPNTAYEDHFIFEPVVASVPAAKWGAPWTRDQKLTVGDANDTVSGALVGCRMLVNTDPALTGRLELPLATALKPLDVDADLNPGAAAPPRVQSPGAGPAAPQAGDRDAVMRAIQAAVTQGAAARASALQALGAWSPSPGAGGFSGDPYKGDPSTWIDGTPLSKI